MATIKIEMELYIGFMNMEQLVDDYLKLFQSRVDTIMVHGRDQRHHSGLHWGVFERMFPGMTNEKFKVLDPGERKKMNTKSKKAHHKKYIACLLL